MLVRMQSGMNIMEHSLAIPYKVKYTFTIQLSNINKKVCLYRKLHENIHSSISHNRSTLELVHMSFIW